MTTPRIEEMVEELRSVFLDVVPRGHQVKDEEVETAAFLFERKLTQARTEAHQAGIDEAVEIVKKQLTALSWSAENETPDAIRIIAAIYDTIKALQDNK